VVIPEILIGDVPSVKVIFQGAEPVKVKESNMESPGHRVSEPAMVAVVRLKPKAEPSKEPPLNFRFASTGIVNTALLVSFTVEGDETSKKQKIESRKQKVES
jgi:hypothetical protein